MRMNRYLKYLHTVKYLKTSQILWRLRISIQKKCYRIKPFNAQSFNNDSYLALPELSSADRNSICIFGKSINPVSVDWDFSEKPKLWLFHLHYFDYLAAFDRDTGIDLIGNWIDNNPIGNSAGWEAYAVSLRVVNWIKFIVQYQIQPDLKIIQSLSAQMRSLFVFREKHLLANHYFKNLVALMYLGHFLSNNKIFNWSVNEICEQINEQSVDGLHFEFSPTYHALFTKDLIDVFNLLKSNNLENELLKIVDLKITSVLHWAQHLSQNGRYIPIGDANFEDCPTCDELIKQYKSVLGGDFKTQDVDQLDCFPKMEHLDFDIMLLNAPFNPSYNPAHSHCDKLSVLLWYNGTPILVDTGNYNYDKTEERDFARSVEAHNTLQIDDLQQAECWDVFRIGHRGKVTNTKVFDDEIQATYQYKNYIHNRKISKTSNGILITDNILYQGCHIYRLYFHINPDLSYSVNDNVTQFDEINLTIKLPGENVTSFKSDYYPEMYIKRLKTTIVAEGTFCDEITLETQISR